MEPQVVYSGAGYVGLTGAIAFARAGVPVVCVAALVAAALG